MTSRAAIKANFQTGDTPTQAQFADLIDSMAHLTEDRNVPNGFAGLDQDGDIIGTPVHRYDTINNLRSIVLSDGEIAMADTGDLFRGNGSTAGGIFLISQPKAYTGGPTALTSHTAYSISIPIRVAKSSIYKIWGVFGFSGDTDAKSNFAIVGNSEITETPSVIVISGLPTLPGLFSTAIWSHAASLQDADARASTPLAVVENEGICVILPKNLTAQVGYCYFDMTVQFLDYSGADYGANWYIHSRLRTTKTGTPTILAQYRIFSQRLK